MIIRLMDAVTDPFFGKLIDKTLSRKKFQFWTVPSGVLMTIGYIALIHPPKGLDSDVAILTYMAFSTLLVSTAAGAFNVAIQAWPIRWTTDTLEQSELVSRREQLTLIGIIVASTLSTATNSKIFTSYLLAVTILTSISILSLPGARSDSRFGKIFDWGWLRSMALLMSPLFLSALANATAATLFMFYVTDYLLLSQSNGGQLLAIYFISALVGIWLWQKTMVIGNTIKSYMLVVLMTVIVFLPGFWLTDANAELFTLICIGTGLLIGAELLLSSMLLIKNIKYIKQEDNSGIILGTWGLLMKLGLALAAGLTLPLLNFWGYQPGLTLKHEGLAVIYLATPISLKIISLILLSVHNRQNGFIYAPDQN
jgi:Na+/melibiose symporter-like transporter